MKTSVGPLVLLGAVLTSGLALAQTLPPRHSGRATAEQGGESGETRAQINSSGATVASETLALSPTQAATAQGSACVSNSTHGGRQSGGTAATPVNGIGGMGGGRYTVSGCRIINNSETDDEVAISRPAPGGATPDSAVQTSNRDHVDQDAQVETRARRSSRPTQRVQARGTAPRQDLDQVTPII